MNLVEKPGIGKRFGRLLVVSFDRHSSSGHDFWLCRCDCGNEKVIQAGSLWRGHTRSCGCITKERMRIKQFRHGWHGTSTYNIWCSMRERCGNPKHQAYAGYGGRGITVCERWQSFENFLSDMGERPYGLSLERRENNQGYSKDNCVWATRKQQSSNRRNNIMICWDDHVMTLKDASQHFGVPYKKAHARIKNLGWSVSDALTKAA